MHLMFELNLITFILLPQPIYGQYSLSIPPENIKKPLVFCVFKEYREGTLA